MTTQQIGQPGAQPPAAAKKASRRGDNKDFIGASPVTPYLFMAPYLVLFLVFVAIPVVYGLWISLHTWDYLLPGKPFVGLQNYVDLFTPGSTTSGPSSAACSSRPTCSVLPLSASCVASCSTRTWGW